MREYILVKVKEDGKLEVPLEYAYEVGLIKDAYFLLEIDKDLKEIHVDRIALPGKRLVEDELIVVDKPGVLAKISGTLGRHGINILFNESEELESLGMAAIVAIVDISNSDVSVKELEGVLAKIEEVKEVKIREIM